MSASRRKKSYLSRNPDINILTRMEELLIFLKRMAPVGVTESDLAGLLLQIMREVTVRVRVRFKSVTYSLEHRDALKHCVTV